MAYYAHILFTGLHVEFIFTKDYITHTHTLIYIFIIHQAREQDQKTQI